MDIQFVLTGSSAANSPVEVKIKNVGTVSYKYRTEYAACDLEYYEIQGARADLGRKFIIPPGTHCDLLVHNEIKPGETKTLFTWNLDECTKDQWGCVESKPLAPGNYRVMGMFESSTGKTTTAEKIFEIRGQPDLKSCTSDAGCKIIYSSCECESTPLRDPRTELPSQKMCTQNQCTNSQQTAIAICEQNKCAVKFQRY